MIRTPKSVVLLVVGFTAVLSGCSADMSPSPAPSVTSDAVVDVADLDGKTITISVGEVLAIQPADRTHALRAVQVDADVAEFVQGSNSSDAIAPEIRGLTPGKTSIVLSDPTGEIEDIAFTLTVKR
ncbi:hypothetical protein [Microbacterium sp. USHLN186]|uniref:hypothetical protein n=1 Tax=Microbacterium sp. USHLN186 TaxID=3081286 RepID=UPI003016CD45